MYKRKLRSLVELKEFLKNPSPKVKVPLYTEDNKQGNTNSKDDTMKKPTLSKRLDDLTNRLDDLTNRLDDLTKLVKDGFTELRQDIKDINARLDYNGLQIERIEKRLDYNNLKKLPESK